MKKKNSIEAFFALIRLGIGHSSFGFPEDVDWAAVKAHAQHHGLSAVVSDGIEKLPGDMRPGKDVLQPWIGEGLQSYDQRYSQYRQAIAEMAKWYNTHGFKMMVLKGYACSLDWPKPEHRPCGDIDIWQFGKQEEADEAMKRECGITIDNSHHHHTVFYWQDFMVENHYDFLNTHHHRSNADYELILKELGKDDSHWIEVNGEKVYVPSPNLHALFLLKHLMGHFAAEQITLRQLLDWAFFVKAHGHDVDWTMVTQVLDRFGMRKMFNILNAICVEDMGFDYTLFPQVQFDPILKDRVLKEILAPEFSDHLPQGLFPRLCFKWRRWKGSAWKHELCYKESMVSAFWSGVWGHLMKPGSI